MPRNSQSFKAEGLAVVGRTQQGHGKHDSRKLMIEEMAKLTRTCNFWSSLFFFFFKLHKNVFIMSPFLFLSANEAQLHSVSPQTGNYDAFVFMAF